ncbi:putative Ig domain-containing protein [Flavobacterium sp. W21_SRS_FM6]|uniref:putative Ig domain-containing protein n=1 Tax=Flavobacterium sp. W21_SRS_FM6 TaxID=3240268 RepID=UPI003F8F9AC3
MKTLSFLTTAFSFFISTLLFTLLTASDATSKTHDHENHRSIKKISALEIRPKTQSKASAFDIELSVDGVTYTFALQPNQKLSKKLSKKQSSALSILKGTIKDTPNSWVRLTLKDGLYSGAFFDGTELFFIDPESSIADIIVPNSNNQRVMSSRTKQVIYKASDVELNATCALEIPNPNAADTFDYSNFVSNLSSMAAAAADRSINVKVLADTEYNTIHNGAAYEKMLSEMNVVDGIFSEQVNVELNITDAIVLSDNGNLNTTNATDLVYNLRTQVAQTIGNQGITHLFTGKELDDNTVGIAFVDALCSSYGVGLSQHFGSQTALVVAHEIGHNFGAPHDAQSGSLCSSTANSFLMNPYINGSNQFSACSLTNIELGITKANTWYSNACVVDISEPGSIAPRITSVAGLEATVGEAYEYDSDNIVEASGSTPLSYSFDYAPDGMTIDSDGLISWTPNAAQIGLNSAQLRVSNAAGEDIQVFDIKVSSANTERLINFNESPNFSYGGSAQDTANGTVMVEDNGATLHLIGNRWRAINLPYTITPTTVIEFDFKSSMKGEIHGIGFDTDLALSENATFTVLGTQKYGIQDYVYSENADYQRFSIPVGQYYTGAKAYLFFAMDHDVPNPAAQSYFRNVRIYEPGQIAPSVISAPRLQAQIGITYQYSVETIGAKPIIYALNDSPEGMTINTAGQINWTPSNLQLGEHTIEIVATNDIGQDIQRYTVTVSQPFGELINFNHFSLLSYGGINGDTNNGTVSVSSAGDSITLIGNRWVAINFPYSITNNSIIEFDFSSSVIGEIHGIGLDKDLVLGPNTTLNLFGMQTYGIEEYRYTTQGTTQHFLIPLGDYLSGDSQYLFFAMDQDVESPNATSTFRNITIYEKPNSPPVITSTPNVNGIVGSVYHYDDDNTVEVNSPLALQFTLESAPEGMTINSAGVITWTPTSEQIGQQNVRIIATNDVGADTQQFSITVNEAREIAIDFNSLSFQGYGINKDGSLQDTSQGTITVLDAGTTLELLGNRWQAAALNYTITPNTVLEFDFKSTSQGEIHGIGLDNNLNLDPSTTFNLYGSQSYGLQDYRYTGSGEYEHYSIPIGAYYTGSKTYLFFAMDDDVISPNGNSYFKNVNIVER